MCTIIQSRKENPRLPIIVTGYKVVCEKDGKFYSPATGIEYKENNFITAIKETEAFKIKLCNRFNNTFLHKGNITNEPRMKGCTFVYKYKTGAINLLYALTNNSGVKIGYTLTLAKITLTNIKYSASYGADTLDVGYLGTKILKIQEI